MEIHRTLGDRVRLYRRREGGAWHCSTYLKGKEWRRSTREKSLARARDIAEDWYLELTAKARVGSLRSGKTFAQAAKTFGREYEAITRGRRRLKWVQATRIACACICCPGSERSFSPTSPPAPRRNTGFTG